MAELGLLSRKQDLLTRYDTQVETYGSCRSSGLVVLPSAQGEAALRAREAGHICEQLAALYVPDSGEAALWSAKSRDWAQRAAEHGRQAVQASQQRRAALAANPNLRV